MDTSTLLADPAAVRLECFVSETNSITLVIHAIQKAPSCPKCSSPSRSLHSHYGRTVADLPWHGVAIKLQLHTRKFRCRNELCKQKIFCERLSKVVDSYARKIVRLNAVLTLLAFALWGEAGSRTAKGLNLSVSGDTLLRRIRSYKLPEIETPKVLGVDDWAKRKGHTYGTIIVDLERRKPIDLLPDREAKTLAMWLETHPEIEIVSRDRSLLYAEGITMGASQAEEVADSWHLSKNFVDVLKEFLGEHHNQLTKARQTIISQQSVEHSKDQIILQCDRRTLAREQTRRKRLALYNKAQKLHKEGCSQKEIIKRLGISKTYARRLINAKTFPERSAFPLRPTSVDKYSDYLDRRWSEGCQTASGLWREIKEQGFTGPAAALIRYVRNRMGDKNQIKVQYKRRRKTPTFRFVFPSSKKAAWLLLKDERELSKEEVHFVPEVLKTSEEINRAVSLTKRFREMIKRKDVTQLEKWLTDAEVCGRKWKNFACSLRQDLSAVKSALTSEWSNGQTEGQVNRLKFLKRQM